MTEKEFLEFCKGKKIYSSDRALKEIYKNNYSQYKQATKHIYTEMAAYHDIYYSYDESKDIIIEERYYIGD